MTLFTSTETLSEWEVLKRIAGVIESQYEEAKSSPALAAVVAQEVEIMLEPLIDAAKQAERAGEEM